MALPIQEQIKYWSIAAIVFFAGLWLLGDVILPFILGGAIAYMLDPVADWMEEHGAPRALAVSLITFVALVIFAVFILLIIPLLVDQSTALFRNLPSIFNSLFVFLNQRFPGLLEEGSSLATSIDGLGQTIQSKGLDLLNTVAGSLSGIVNVIVLVFFVPVVAFYLLLDWDRLIGSVDSLLPLDHAPIIRQLAGQIDQTLAAFIRGQGTVCLILGTFYAVSLMLVGLQFGLVVGFIAGLISFIPFVGALFGGVLAIGLALFQFWGDWVWIAVVAGIFMVGQMVEGNILTPKLVGNSVGLHPVWLIFALSAFGAVFGFVGLLVAVPVTASLGVIARFAIGKYKGSRLYRGLSHDHSAEE
ncbi:MAG: AI-2E family transporter [Pseudomonadota bacterium]